MSDTNDEIKQGERRTTVYNDDLREMCRITPTGKIMIDWSQVERTAAKHTYPPDIVTKVLERRSGARNQAEFEVQLKYAEIEQWVWFLALHMLAVRDGTWEPLP